jgi:hypothetical protein
MGLIGGPLIPLPTQLMWGGLWSLGDISFGSTRVSSIKVGRVCWL